MPSPEYLDRLIQKQPSLPKARQWLEWLDYHHDHLPAGHGWESCLRDTLVGLHHHIAISARRLRGNPIWDIQGTMATDIEPLEPQAMRVLKRLENIKKGESWYVPERFSKAMDCLYGACRQQVRLAREIDQMRERGVIDVDVLIDVKSEIAVEQ